MPSDELYAIALSKLQADGHLRHSQLLHFADFDESLKREVCERLIRAGLAEDQYGIELVWIAPPDVFTDDGGSESPMATAGQGRTGDAPGSPHSSRGKDVAQRTTDVTSKPQSSPTAGGAQGGPLRYFFWDAGRETGPFPREDLEQRLVEGRLQPNEFIRIESDDEWIPAALALNRTGPSPATHSTRKRPAPTPAEEVIAASKLAMSIAAAAKQTMPPKLDSQPAGQMPPRHANDDWLTPYGGRGRLQNAAAVLVVVLGLWVYWSWPPAVKSISTEFHQYVMQLDGIKDPVSPAWKAFVVRTKPRIQKLVESLKPRAIGANSVERNLFSAGEKGLLPMLDEGLGGESRKKFNTYWNNAQLLLEGTAPADQASADPRAHAAPSASTMADSAIPPGASMTAAHAPPGVRPVKRPAPPGAKKPTR